MKKLTILFFVFLFVSLATAVTFTDSNPFEGTFTNTFYNSSGFIQLNISQGFLEGTYSNTKTGTGINISYTKGYGWALEEIGNASLETKEDSANIINKINYTGLKMYLPMDNSSQDFSGYGYVSSTSLSCNTDREGKINTSCGSFGDKLLTYSEDMITTTEFAICSWVNVFGTGGGLDVQNPIFSQRDALTGNNKPVILLYAEIGGNIAYTLRSSLGSAESVSISRLPYNEFHFYCGVTNSSHHILYIDGEQEGIITNNQAGNYNIVAGTRNIAGNKIGTIRGLLNGSIDEVSVWERELSSLEINNLYKRGATRLNLTASDGTTTLSTGYGNTYLNISSLTGTTINYTAYFETDNLSYSPLLYNVTLNYESGGTPTTYTTINHLDYEVVDSEGLEIDTATYSLLANFTFNLTTYSDFVLKTSGQVQKSNHPASTTMSLKYISNGIELFDNSIVTLPGGTEERRVFTTPISEVTGMLGENNIEIWVKESGTGGINISSMELHIDFNRSSASKDINQQVVNISGQVGSTDFVHIANWTFTRWNNATGIVGDIHITMESVSGGDTVGSCQIRSGANNISEVVDRYLTSGGTGSTGLNQIINATGTPYTLNPELWCTSGSIGATLNITATAHNLELADSDGNVISYATNSVSDLTLNTGWNKINTITGGARESGEATILAYINAQAITGGSTNTNSPLFKINSSTLPEVNCSLTYARSLESSNSPGLIKMYSHCSGFAVGVPENVSLWVWVATGEQIEIISSNLAGYEGTEVSTNPINSPPIVSIQNPINNSIVQGWDFINYTVSDPEGQSTTCSITLNGTTDYVLSSDATSPFELNWGIYVPNNYTLQVYCTDILGETGFSIHSIEIIADSSGLTADQENCIFYGTFVNGTTCAIGEAGGEKQMAGISLVIFMLAIIGALFALPYKIERFTKNNVTDFILKRSCFAIGIYLLMLTSAMLATVIESVGIDLTSDIFMMTWIIGIAGYLSLVWLVFGTVIEVTKLWKQQVNNKRMDEDEYDE